MNQSEFFFMKRYPNSVVNILAVNDPAIGLLAKGKGITDIWEKENNAKVQLTVIPWAEYPAVLFDLLEKKRSDYDVIMAPGYFWLPKFASSGWLFALDEIIEENHQLWDVYEYDDIHPRLRIELEYYGKHYFFPCFSEIQLVYYRSDFCKAAGIDLIKMPIASEDYINYSRLFHNPPACFGTQIKASLAESFPEWLPWLSEFGGELFDSMKNPVFHAEPGLKALEFMLKLKKYCAPNIDTADNEQILHLVNAGKIGIINHWSGQISPVLGLNGRSQNKTISFSHLKKPWGSIWSFGINAASKNIDSAFSYLCWATSKQADQAQILYSGSPVRLSTFRNEQFKKLYPWLQVLESAINCSQCFPSFVEFLDTLGPLYTMVNSVLTKNVSAKEELIRTKELCQRAIMNINY